MYTKRLLKFHGHFRDLKPAGYVFHKLFARNYRCYEKEGDAGQSVWVWQHHGGYIEIDDCDQWTALVVDAILCGKSGPFALDMQNNDLVPWDPARHDCVFLNLRGEDAINKHFERWRRIDLRPSTIAEIKAMSERGWIKDTGVVFIGD